ncbi:sensor histidine kinase [Actinoplanes sp. NPDC051851]|uniref:sensor histidine kinase n=1 Tax=Actinoplanes sp. NPDC051851 TaxID=3154753 RepID=UPI003418E6B7
MAGSIAFSLVAVGLSGPAAEGWAAAIALTAVQAGALWWLVRWPTGMTLVLLGVSAGLHGVVPGFGPGIAFVVLCTYAWLRPAAQALWMLPPAVVAVCGPAVLRGRWDLAGLWLGGVVLAWSWGALGRAGGARRAAQRRQAVLEERARIARELHDVLAHTVSLMVVQVAAADDVFDSHPEKAREAVRRTERAGREALAELRGFLRSVREDPAGAPSGGAGSPQPTLADIDRLAETMGEAGLRVTVRRAGEAEVPLGVQVNAYRIVQEALTNTLRHARASQAEVQLRVDEAEVSVRVVDDGDGATARNRAGHGLIGMRERVDLLGGELRAAPRDGGGFEVEARLPVRHGTVPRQPGRVTRDGAPG